MRLTSIKLAGFKSFVDPTKVELRSQLTAIVGPNGCGKSNIIDAVRWVMGESSAKQLRGESIVDVIFNGSTHRAPVSQASIELHFDNQDGLLGGEYAAYSEIIVRRQVSRDGQSYYSLNGSRCRRKDITDLFLGTGLGPRSYAIIEQGTISRLVEAKPDELRLFLEEAAGISKYKERRKETETRLNHTRDNLARLNDIREELTKQIQHLDRQAKAAERFKGLKNEERHLKTQLLWVKSRALKAEWHQKDQEINHQHDQLIGLQSQLATLEASNSERLEQQQNAQTELNLVQQHYMEQGTQIARLEQSINHHQQRYQQLQEDIRQLAIQTESQTQLKTRDEAQLAEIAAQQLVLNPQLIEKNQALALSNEALHQTEHNAQLHQTAWDQLSHTLVQASHLAQQKQHELQQSEQQHQHALQQQQKWQQEQLQCEQNLHNLGPDDNEAKWLILQEQQQIAEQALTDSQTNIEQQRQRLSNARSVANQSQQQLTAQQAQLTALETYQQQALTRSQPLSNAQRQELGLQNTKPLLELLTVETGYEAAVENLLSHWLRALCTDDLAAVLAKLTSPSQQWLIDTTLQTVDTHDNDPTFGEPLSTKVQGPAAIKRLLSNAYVCSRQIMALHYAQLKDHITLISPDGLVLKAGLLQMGQVNEEPQGMLERQRQIQALSHSLEQIHQQLQQQQAEVSHHERTLAELEQTHHSLQQHWQQLSRQCHQQQSVVHIHQAKQQQLQDRLQGLHKQLQQNHLDIETIDQKHHGLREAWQEALNTLNDLNLKRDSMLEERNQHQHRLQQQRSTHQALQQQTHQLTLQEQRLQSEQNALQQQCQRLNEQLNQCQQRNENLHQNSTEVLEPIAAWQLDLEHTLEQRFQQEQRLDKIKHKVQTLTESFRQVEQQRRELELRIEQQRDQLDTLRLTAEALHTRWLSLEEQKQVDDVGEPDNTIASMSEADLQQQLDEIGQKIQRLGLVNLTAIEEFASQTARKTYLDQQYQDLMEAITTLENAIRTIDRETKARFQKTFDQVNQNFQNLFPSVFAGGKAYLELTGDDLLNTGVAIFAQPVGKRNSTIHLLSGGEKALTAVALVFAIFQINPAPFCMLDEVDAPLDDSNVARFCQLVNVMADKTQFIMVTHNKVAMEMANQLMGITMQEPGVSRLVAVDMAEAIAMIDH